MDWETFFKSAKNHVVVLKPIGGDGSAPQMQFSMEYMYQNFKARIVDELRVISPELLESAELVEIEK
jgi:hypothetical protein